MAFSNRAEAAGRLVELLRAWPAEHLVVVALAPRGVALAARVAGALGAPLDAVVVEELAVDGCPHGVLGAAAETGATVLNPDIAAALGVSPPQLRREAARAAARAAALRRALRDTLPARPWPASTAVLITDGVCTGAPVSLGLALLRERAVKQLVLAVPVCPRSALASLRARADTVLCVRQMPYPRPVDEWYDHYREITSQYACDLVRRATTGPALPEPPLATSTAGRRERVAGR